MPAVLIRTGAAQSDSAQSKSRYCNMITEKEAIDWVAGLFEQPGDQLTPETPRDEIPIWDSLGVLTLMAEFDEKFGIILSDTDMRAMQKVDDILEVLRRNGKLQSSPECEIHSG